METFTFSRDTTAGSDRIMPVFLPVVAGLFLVFTSLLPAASAHEIAKIQVTSSGSVEALPDFINLDISIEQLDADRAKAKNQADIITSEVLDAAASLGIDDKHIQASQLYVSPQYRWTEQTREVIGQKAVRTVQIKLYDLEKYSELADRLVKIDITRLHQRGFGFDSIETHQNLALVEALKHARDKAEKIASEVGREISETFQVYETIAQPGPVLRHTGQPMMAEAAMDSAPAPLEIGKQTISASINVIYLLAPLTN